MLFALLAQTDAGDPRPLVFKASVVTFICTLLVPVVVAIVTKSQASPRLKAVVTMVLTAAVTLLANAKTPNGDAIVSLQTGYEWAVNTAIAVVAYLGLWKPVTQVNERMAPNAGLTDRPQHASPPPPPPDHEHVDE